MLQLCILAITDKENNPALPGTQALVIGILVTIIGASLGMNTGYAINPSRDLPPRFFTFIAGWGTEVFRYYPCLYPHSSPRPSLGTDPAPALGVSSVLESDSGVLGERREEGDSLLIDQCWPQVNAGVRLVITSLACRAGENWWWVPVVAPPLGAYIGGIVYLVFIGSRAPRESQGPENSAVSEDHGLTALPKTSSHFPVMSTNTPSVQPIATVSDSMPLESF